MFVTKLYLASLKISTALMACVFLVGCELTESEMQDIQSENQAVGADASRFDGTWRSQCVENQIVGAPEAHQPDGYVQSTLALDSATNSYIFITKKYFGPQCGPVNQGALVREQSGDISFDGLTTTSSGLEATVVRYFNNGTVPDTTGLLYRDGDILYRDLTEGSVIEDIVPTQLAFRYPWQLL